MWWMTSRQFKDEKNQGNEESQGRASLTTHFPSNARLVGCSPNMLVGKPRNSSSEREISSMITAHNLERNGWGFVL